MKNNKNRQLPVFRLTALAMSLCAAQSSVYAMQALNEQDLRAVNAQDGIMLDTQYDSLNIDRLYWEDKVGMSTGSDTALRAYADGISITKNSPTDHIGTTYKINAGSDTGTGKAGVDLSIVSRYGTITADAFKICDNTGANCGQSPFGLTVQSTKDAKLHFITQDGLFSPTSLSTAEISLVDVNIYLSNLENTAQPQSLSSTINQLILKGFNFNVKGQGYMYVDPIKGLVLSTEPGSGTGTSGYFDLNRVCTDAASCATVGLKAWNSKPGLNIDFVAKKNSGNINGKTTYNVDNTSGMIRVGASGRLKNASLTIRGTNGATDTNGAILGEAYSAGNSTFTPDSGSVNIMGSSGIAMRVKADFTNDGSNPTTLELGHGGDNAYALQFSNFSPLLIRKQDGGAFNPDAAYFDSGNVYVNLANTKRLALPENSVLNAAKFLGGKLTESGDYSQLVHNETANPNAIVVATRGTDFQALSRHTEFIADKAIYTDDDTSNDPVGGGSWGLGLPFYNLNSNLAIYGTTFTGKPYGSAAVENAQRLGFALGMTTQGVSADGSKTTSILLIDGKKYGTALDANNVRQASSTGDPINYYIGVRNIDMLLKGYGSIGMENGSLNLNIPDFMFAAAGQVAVGYLPGSQYKTSLGGTAKYAPIDGFLTTKDVLFGLRLRMAGSVDMTMVPGGTTAESNFISFDGNLNLTSGAVQIVEPVDGSIIGLDNITGKLGFSNQIKIHKDNVDFNTAFTINPNKDAAGVLRIKDFNLYPATGGVPGNAQRLGEMVFTGGKITSQFNITPH